MRESNVSPDNKIATLKFWSPPTWSDIVDFLIIFARVAVVGAIGIIVLGAILSVPYPYLVAFLLFLSVVSFYTGKRAGQQLERSINIRLRNPFDCTLPEPEMSDPKPPKLYMDQAHVSRALEEVFAKLREKQQENFTKEQMEMAERHRLN